MTGIGSLVLYGDVDYAGVADEQLGDDYLDGGDDELRGGSGNDVLHGDVFSAWYQTE